MHHPLHRLSRLVLLAGSCALAACAEGIMPDEPSAPPVEEVDDLRALLATPVVLNVADTSSGSLVRVEAVSLRDAVPSDVELGVRGGTLVMSLDPGAKVIFEELAVTGDDVQVSAAVVPPSGLTLTDLSVELSQPASAPPVSQSETAMTTTIELGMDLRWSVALDHGIVDLAPIRLDALPFDVSVVMNDDGTVSASLTSSRTGAFWSWASLFELRDLEIALVATSELAG